MRYYPYNRAILNKCQPSILLSSICFVRFPEFKYITVSKYIVDGNASPLIQIDIFNALFAGRFHYDYTQIQ